MNKPYSRKSGVYASLATLVDQWPGSDGSTSYSTENTGQIVINFPCMPETLEMARQATYTSISAIPLPDGFHIYHHTDPLRIPLKFSLSAKDDDYTAQDGPYALLAIAARLHALVMPVPNNSAVNQLSTAVASSVTGKSNGAGSEQAQAATNIFSGGTEYVAPNTVANVYFPPACILAIVMSDSPTASGNGKMGINCRGFVERVNVTFRGPWLQGSFSQALAGQSGATPYRNLPSFADYEFTFVHQPSYTNNIFSGQYAIPTTTAGNIFQRFYAEGAVSNAQITYADLNGSIVGQSVAGQELAALAQAQNALAAGFNLTLANLTPSPTGVVTPGFYPR
jgi:hypothetical protein